ncbi:nitroreductase family deazaflavin-dependent oxidoreductase [Micromonospora sediminicola]|uniref:nitroreductase family deazaflavin-dependent oxidoreductase n=1 Tax=Micromonospora sediminicola TaxID=946078 RepID=UPI0033C336F7
MDTMDPAEFNADVVERFRAGGGQVGGPLADTPLILVHHIGRRSGVERVVPLAYLSRPHGRFLIVAANGGSETHPAWYYNLKANPEVTVEVGTETFRVVARQLNAAERSALWPTIVEMAPAVGMFQSMTDRAIPVFVLTPQGRLGARCDTC